MSKRLPLRTPSAALVTHSPLPTAVQELVFERFRSLHPALAANPELSETMWKRLYSPTCPAPVAEQLLWRTDLTAAHFEHTFGVRRESRKAPVAAALASSPSSVPEKHLLSLCHPDMPVQLADLLVSSSSVSERVRSKAAPYASFKVAMTWILRDHRKVPDRVVLDVLGRAPGTSRQSWPLLVGMVLDRPGVLRRLSEVPWNPTVAWIRGMVGVPAAEQVPFLKQLAGMTSADFFTAWRVAVAIQVYRHPLTTKATLEWVRSCAKRQPFFTRVVAEELDGPGPLGWGQDPSRISSRRRIEALLADSQHTSAFGSPTRLWVLAALARNPNLTEEDRSHLGMVFDTVAYRSFFANCAAPARQLAASGIGDLAPVARWRQETQVGSRERLWARLGEPAGRGWSTDATDAGELRVRYLGTDPTYDDLEAGAWLAKRFGDDVPLWEVALTLADDFQGTLEELASSCAALVR